MDKELIKQAIEALESCSGAPHWETLQPTLTALRKKLVTPLVLPDKLNPGDDTPGYVEGWNECREVMAGMMK
jgi:hypothetical protein